MGLFSHSKYHSERFRCVHVCGRGGGEIKIDLLSFYVTVHM